MPGFSFIAGVCGQFENQLSALHNLDRSVPNCTRHGYTGRSPHVSTRLHMRRRGKRPLIVLFLRLDLLLNVTVEDRLDCGAALGPVEVRELLLRLLLHLAHDLVAFEAQ